PQWYANQASFATATPITIASGDIVPGIDATLAATGTRCAASVPLGAPPARLIGVDIYSENSSVGCGYPESSDHRAGADRRAGTSRVEFHDRQQRYSPQWYDNQASFATATPITVASGDIVPGIDGTLTAPVTRSGTSLLLDGQPYRPIGLNIYNANSNGWCWYQ